jgi:DNA-binding response OmpR family regulator
MIDARAKKVLIVSVDRAYIELMTALLPQENYIITLAHDNVTLSDALLHDSPDIIFVDFGLNQDTNIELLDALRAHDGGVHGNVPVIAASQNGDPIEISAAIKLHVNDYIIKSSIDREQLDLKIKRLLVRSLAETDLGVSHSPIGDAPLDMSLVKLLIIEDDKFLRDLAVQKISKEGFNVLSAPDGEQGLALAEKEIPHVMLLDILLPGIDGFEVLRRLRANPKMENTKIAMLSNFGQREDVEKALNIGADMFMIKANFTLDEIVQEVKRIVATPRSELRS